jgi:rubrerythrin
MGSDPTSDPTEAILTVLEGSRQREKHQTSFYRVLAVLAELAGDEALSERFNALLADEQHHLSRLTARILELGGTPGGFGDSILLPSTLKGWEGLARVREEEEVSWYAQVIEGGVDPQSRVILQEILDSEQRHAQELGGKWMSA